MIELSKRIQQVAPSITLAITAKAKQLKAAGEDVIGFGAGEPDFDTPESVKQAAIEALNQGRTKYTPVDGIPELKDAIRDRIAADHQLSYDYPEIAVTVGAKQAIYNLIQALINPGDGVLIPAPYWVSYPDQVRLADGEPQIVETRFEDGFRLSAQALDDAVKPNSRLLILNSPCNPTGAALGRDALVEIADVVRKHNLLVISDEIYEKLVYDGFRQDSIVAVDPTLKDQTAIVNGMSKAYAMTGWRLGYICGPQEWVRAAVKLQGQSTSNPTSFAQYAGVKALQLDDSEIEAMRDQFETRRNEIVDALNDISGVSCPKPDGAFYVFPSIANAIEGRFENTVDFAAELLNSEKVAVVPGEGFGAPGHIRLSYASGLDEIRSGIQRIKRFIDG